MYPGIQCSLEIHLEKKYDFLTTFPRIQFREIHLESGRVILQLVHILVHLLKMWSGADSKRTHLLWRAARVGKQDRRYTLNQ